MSKTGIFFIFCASLLAATSGLAFDETGAHSVLKHDLIDSIVFKAKPARIIDLFGGEIVYGNRRRGSEVGAGGRLIMNGFASEYYINDILYHDRKATTCQVGQLQDQLQAVNVHVTNEDLSRTAFSKSVAGYIDKLKLLAL